MAFIELNRAFTPYLNSGKNGRGSPSLFKDEITWDTLLKLYRVAILAEANSGKTIELQEMQKKLTSQGKIAFFLPIEEICDSDFRNCLSPTERDSFDEWQRTEQDAYFFLDSVDEAKVKQKTFRSAMKNLGSSIQPNLLHRARVFISSRPKDWNESAELEEFDKWLRPPKSKKNVLGMVSPTKRELLLKPIFDRSEPAAAKRDKNSTNTLSNSLCFRL